MFQGGCVPVGENAINKKFSKRCISDSLHFRFYAFSIRRTAAALYFRSIVVRFVVCSDRGVFDALYFLSGVFWNTMNRKCDESNMRRTEDSTNPNYLSESETQHRMKSNRCGSMLYFGIWGLGYNATKRHTNLFGFHGVT